MDKPKILNISKLGSIKFAKDRIIADHNITNMRQNAILHLINALLSITEVTISEIRELAKVNVLATAFTVSVVRNSEKRSTRIYHLYLYEPIAIARIGFTRACRDRNVSVLKGFKKNIIASFG